MRKEIAPNKACVVFIGNGFDMHVGMHSSFDDFFKTQCFSNGVFNLEENNNLLYLLIYLRFYYDFRPQEDFFNRITLSNINWMDIESFIKKIATEKEMLSKLYYCYQRSVMVGNVLGGTLGPKMVLIINCLKRRNLQKNEDQSIIGRILFDDLKKFKRDFVEYLNEENKKINSISRNEFLAKILDVLYEEKQYPEYSFITNFNYTFISNEVEEYHIHGTLNEDIVIGYDSSSSQINNEDLFELSKEWQKLVFEPVLPPDFMEVDSLIFYGHSLGEQDYPYFFDVFDNVKLLDKNSKVVLWFCYSEFEESGVWKLFDKYRMNVVKLLNAYEKASKNDVIRNKLLTYLFDSGRLKFKKI